MEEENKPKDQEYEGPGPGWLDMQEYGDKYGLTKNQVNNLRRTGCLKAKIEGKYPPKAYILDVPVMDQPVEKKYLGRFAEYHRTGKGGNKPKVDERRKKQLREVYLPIFLNNAPPDRMVFTGDDFIKLFGIHQTVLYRDWHKWGLVKRDVPENYRELSDKPIRGYNYYYRRDIVRFLSGDWDPPKEGTPDDILIGAAEDRVSLDGEYYKFDPARVYPPDGNGVLAWIEDMEIMREDRRENKWVRFVPWEKQREFIKEAFSLKENGDYKYNLIICSAPRGEGKTYLVAVLTLFRFFNRYGEIVNLSGNSKDQATFAHYELCKKIIQNTPRLKNTPGLVIKEKSLALMGGPKEAICQIKAIPTSTGLLPGTTCAVFTELHNLEDRKFFIDLWTSTRATPNAMVLVDTTVAAPGHIVYELWESYQNGEDPLLYFHHYADKHYNPETTPEQLNSFRRHMLEHEYNMYFRNRWEDATGGLFTPQKIKEMGYCGIDGEVGTSVGLESAIQNLAHLENKRLTFEKGKVDLAEVNREIQEVQSRLIPVDKIYKLPATPNDLDRISNAFGVNFIIGIGIDRSQQLGKGADRTALVCVARGVVSAEVSYYFVLDIFMPHESVLPVITERISDWTMLYGWVDKVAIESYLGADIHAWCQDRGYDSELIYPSFKAQKPLFTELYQLAEQGHLKTPRVPYYTDDEGTLYRGFTTKDDILREEMKMFTYRAKASRGWFGSPNKQTKGGVKDDVVYALAWAIYATQGENATAMGRKSMRAIGESIVNRDVVGDYRGR